MSKRLYLLVIFFMLAFFKGQSIRKEDKYTGEIFSYSPVTLWEDGTTMIDSKIDGVIYVKESNKYYRRNYPQVLNASCASFSKLAFCFGLSKSCSCTCFWRVKSKL